MAYLLPQSWSWPAYQPDADWPALCAPDSPLLFSSPSPDVKEEPDDPACFIMELSAPPSRAPPTEVPLRATQASSDMRRMMNVFRLNPFAIHNGGCAVPAPFESAHPLDAEPITFEFQLDIDPAILDPDAPAPHALHDPGLRPFSPDFGLHSKVPDDPWPACHDSVPTWDISYPDAQLPFVEEPAYHHPMSTRRASRLHSSLSPPYIHHHKPVTLPADSAYHPTTSTYRAPSPQPDPIQWAHQSSMRDVGYHTCTAAASRSTSNNAYTDSSFTSLRRWSLPDPHVHPASSHFLI